MKLVILLQDPKNLSERSKYIIDLLFSGIFELKFGKDYIIIGEEDFFSSPNFFLDIHEVVIIFLGYTRKETLLTEQNNPIIKGKTITLFQSKYSLLRDRSFPKIHLEKKISPEELFSENGEIDYLSTIFFSVTEYERYNINFPLDNHNRKDESETLAIKNEWNRLPYVEIIADKIKNLILKKNPIIGSIFPSDQHAQKIITIDIDHPFRYLHKPLYVTIPALIRDCIKLNFTRLEVLLSRKDPFDIYSKITELFSPNQVIYFILLNGRSGYDDYFTSKNKGFIKLIKQISETGSEIGIHPSYESYLNFDKIKKEKEALENIIGKNITSSRQHFLRYNLPETYQYLESLGIQYEFTTCYSRYNGFKHGMCRPFYWYDLKEERKSNLILKPTVLMDRSFLNQRTNIEDSIKETDYFWNIIRSNGGLFIPLLHNDSLSDTDEWKDWSKYWEYLSKLSNY